MDKDLTVLEIAKLTGLSRKAIDHKIERYGIKPSGQRIMSDGKKARTFSSEFIKVIIDGKIKGRPTKVYYRVSVFDNELLGFVVTNAGLTEREANDIRDVYQRMGYAARVLPCIKKNTD